MGLPPRYPHTILGYTVPFALVHTEKYMAEDKF